MNYPTLEEVRAEKLRRGIGVAKAQTGVLWTPFQFRPDGSPNPQKLAYESEADELGYGGAGGSGKTDLLLGLACTAHHSSVIFRREYRRLEGAEGMIERARQIIGSAGSWSGPVCRDIPGGRAVQFAGVERETDKEKWRGSPHDLKAFDELPEFSETQYLFLIGWLRTSVVGQRLRVVSTFNPPSTPEGQWVIRRFGPWLDRTHPRPARSGELRWFAMLAGKDTEVPGPEPVPDPESGRLIAPRSRTFIHASVEDNPVYMATGYDRILDNLPEPLRSQMRYGDFGTTQDDNQWQVIPTAWVQAAQARWRARGLAAPTPEMRCNGLGCDPARGGAAEFVIAKRFDNWVAPLEPHPGVAVKDGAAGAALLFHATRGKLDTPIGIDVIGSAGSSVYDHAKELKNPDNQPQLSRVLALNGSEASPYRDKSGKLGFYNRRAQWHWRLREYLDPSSGMDIALPPDPQLLADLCAPRWEPTPRGIKVEPKPNIIERLGRSPDRGEAVIYAFAEELALSDASLFQPPPLMPHQSTWNFGGKESAVNPAISTALW